MLFGAQWYFKANSIFFEKKSGILRQIHWYLGGYSGIRASTAVFGGKYNVIWGKYSDIWENTVKFGGKMGYLMQIQYFLLQIQCYFLEN